MNPLSASRALAPASPAAWLDAEASARSRRDILARYSRHALDRDLRTGAVVRLLPDTYVGARHATTFDARAAAALLWAGPGIAIGGAAAAFAHGLLPTPPHHITLVAPRSARLRRPDWIRVIQPTIGVPAARARGLVVVPIHDSLVQSWGELGPDAATGLILDSIRTGRTTAGALTDRARAYPRIHRRRTLVALLNPLRGGIDSYLEHLAARRVFNTVEFAGFRRQVRVAVKGRAYTLDMYNESVQVAVELDGRAFHGDDVSRRRDLARDAELSSAGILTLRLTFEDVTRRPVWCRERVRGAMAKRRGGQRAG